MANIQSLSFSEALKSSTSKIFVFSGRARRSEFWWSMMTVYIICATIPALGLIGSVVSIPITFRRLHDTGRSGWWCGANIIVQFVLGCSLIYKLLYFGFGWVDPLFIDIKFVVMQMTGLLVMLIALAIYQVVLIVMLCQDSELFENRYGPSPKYA